MTATLSGARDAIFKLFQDAWEASAGAENGGTVPPVRWQGLDGQDGPVDAASPWARVTARHIPSGQTTFGETGNRRFTRRGIVTVQVFAPVGNSGLARLENLATIARNAFEGNSTPNGVWFRNATILEIGPYQGWEQMNVTADFVYDEVK